MSQHDDQLYAIWERTNPTFTLNDIRSTLDYDESNSVLEKLFMTPEVQDEVWINSNGLKRLVEMCDDVDDEYYRSEKNIMLDVLGQLRRYMVSNNMTFTRSGRIK